MLITCIVVPSVLPIPSHISTSRSPTARLRQHLPLLGTVLHLHPYRAAPRHSSTGSRLNSASGGADSNRVSVLAPRRGARIACLTACANSRSITSFQVRYFQGGNTPDNDSYEVTLGLKSDQAANSPTITLLTRISPRNLPPGATVPGRAFDGAYYDEIK